MTDDVRAPAETDLEDRANVPLPHGPGSVNEPDEADGPMEEPADVYRSRAEIERLRREEGPLPRTPDVHPSDESRRSD
jgi:hypothetical protein